MPDTFADLDEITAWWRDRAVQMRRLGADFKPVTTLQQAVAAIEKMRADTLDSCAADLAAFAPALTDAIRASERERCAFRLRSVFPADFLIRHGLHTRAGARSILAAAAAEIEGKPDGTKPSLSDLMDPAELAEAIEAGFVKVQYHPDLPLEIRNYTERAQWEREWNPVTRQCRGLITDTSGTVLARPWAKFFNYGEHPEGSIDLAAPAEVTDKMDGSLGIMYPVPDGWAIATRGSFASDQAAHATQVLRERYPDFEPPNGMTCLFEIIYPLNRIVVDYGGTDDLILLGAVDIATGKAVGPDWVSLWDGPMADTFSARTLAEALALPPRPNAEGVVVRIGDLMIKIKQDDYVYLHRLITGMNARVVWERIGEGESASDICAALPEEFWPWVQEVGGDLIREKNRIIDEAMAEHERMLATLPAGWTRKDYAALASRSPLRAWLFMLLDGKDPSAKIWRTLRPSGERTLVATSEDTA